MLILRTKKVHSWALLIKTMTPETPITVGHAGWSPDFKSTPMPFPPLKGLCPSDATTCSALFDLLMEQIDAARKRSDASEKQCREEENDIEEACKHARVSNVLWHIYHYGLHIAAHPPGCKICEFEEGWGKPFCESCGKIFPPNA